MNWLDTIRSWALKCLRHASVTPRFLRRREKRLSTGDAWDATERGAINTFREIEAILAEVDPLPILGIVSSLSELDSPQHRTRVERDANLVGMMPETLTSLALKFEITEPRPGPQPDQVQHVLDLMFDGFHQATVYLMLRAMRDRSIDEEQALFRVLALIRKAFIRGDAYYHQILANARGMFGRLDSEMLDAVGFTIDDAIRISQAIERIVLDRHQEFSREIRETDICGRRLSDLVRHWGADIRQRDGDEQGRPGDSDTAISPAIARRYAEVISERASSCYTVFRLAEDDLLSSLEGLAPERVRSFLRRASCGFGSNHRGYLLPWQGSVLDVRPLIVHENMYYCLHLRKLAQGLDTLFEADLQGDRYIDALNRAKSDFLERSAMDAFTSLLRDAEAYRNVLYRVGAGRGDEYELDGLILHDHFAILIECKSRRLSRAARFGNLDALRADLRNLLFGTSGAYSQTLRAHAEVTKAELVTFREKHGGRVREVRKSELLGVVSVVVTLDQLYEYSTEIGDMYKIGFDLEGPIPWVVSLNDLQAVVEILEFPPQLFHYLALRSQIVGGPYWTSDELEYLGLYLRHGLNLSWDHEKYDRLALLGWADEIDAYFYGKEGAAPAAPRPQQNMPELYRKILETLSGEPHDYCTRVGMVLLEMDGRSRADLDECLRGVFDATAADSRIHDRTMLSENVAVVVVSGRGRDEVQDALGRFLLLRKYMCGADEAVGFGFPVRGSARNYAVEGPTVIYDRTPWEYSEAMEELGGNLPSYGRLKEARARRRGM